MGEFKISSGLRLLWGDLFLWGISKNFLFMCLWNCLCFGVKFGGFGWLRTECRISAFSVGFVIDLLLCKRGGIVFIDDLFFCRLINLQDGLSLNEEFWRVWLILSKYFCFAFLIPGFYG